MTTEEKVLEFLNRSQSKISELTTHVMNRVNNGVEANEEVDLAIQLLDLNEALLCHYNDWDDNTKEGFIDWMTDYAKLTDFAIIDYGSYDIPPFVTIPGGTGEVTMADLLGVAQASQARDNTLEQRIIDLENQEWDFSDLFPQSIKDEIAANTEARHTHGNKSILDQINQTMLNLINVLQAHYDNSTRHITGEERAAWNAKISAAQLTEALASKANLSHTHEQSEIIGLQSALNAFQQQLDNFPVPSDGNPGVTPNIQIGTVTEGEEFAIELDENSTVENPILNFTLVKGDKGDAFKVDATGLESELPWYLNNSSAETFMSTDTGKLWFKKNGQWTGGAKVVGSDGWTPVFGLHEHSPTVTVLRLIDWIGGTGNKPVLPVPANWNQTVIWYVGIDGFTLFPHQAINVKGTGAQGRAFRIDQQGLDRSVYDNEPEGFTFLKEDTGYVYFKVSSEEGDWSEGFRWRGNEGPMGELPPNPVDKYTLEYDASLGVARWVPRFSISRDGYKGAWNAKTNTPDLTDANLISTLLNGDFYRVSDAWTEAEVIGGAGPNATINGNNIWNPHDLLIWSESAGFQRVLGSDNPADVLDDTQKRTDRTYSSTKIVDLINEITSQAGHTHLNLSILNLFSQDTEGGLLFNGQPIEGGGLGPGDVIDNLISIETGKALSANQGRVLKGLIDAILYAIQSDDETLDTVQEIVEYIKANRADLDPIIVKSHDQNTDQYLDYGGPNQISAAEAKGKVDKSGGDEQLEVTITTPSTWYGAATQMLRAAIQKIHDFINSSVFKVSDVDVSDISEGESKIPTVVKQGGVPVITGAVRKVDKLGPATLANYLDDSKSWVNGVLEINGANPEATHPLGYNGLEFTYKRRWYLCRSHVYDDVNGYAKWEMNTMITMLNSDDPYDLSIITELEATSGWVDDLKTVTVKSVKGDEWVQQSTGYSFKCIDNNNTWFRIRSTYLNLITDTTLINQIKAVTKEQWGSGNVYNLPSGNQGDFFADDTDTYTYFCIDTASHTWKRIGQQPARFAAITDATLIAEIEAHDFAATPKLTPVATEQGVHLQEHCWENPAGTIHYARKVKIGTQFYWVKIK